MSRGQFTPRHAKEARAALPQEGKQAVVNERADGSSLSLSLSRDLPLRTRTRTSCRRGAVLSSTTRAMTRWRGNVRRRSGLGRPWSSSSSSSSPSPPPSLSPPPQHHRRSLSRPPGKTHTHGTAPSLDSLRHRVQWLLQDVRPKVCTLLTHRWRGSKQHREGRTWPDRTGRHRKREKAPDAGWVRASSHVALQWQSICTTVCTVLYCAGQYPQPRVVSIAWGKGYGLWLGMLSPWVGRVLGAKAERDREGGRKGTESARPEGRGHAPHTHARGVGGQARRRDGCSDAGGQDTNTTRIGLRAQRAGGAAAEHAS